METTIEVIEPGVPAIEAAPGLTARAAVTPRPLQYERFTPLNRILHALMIISFIALATTGMSLKFSYTAWAAFLSRMLGGFETAGFIHRASATVMFGIFVTHLWDLNRKRKREYGGSILQLIFGRDSMMFNRQDLRDFVARGETEMRAAHMTASAYQ